MENVACAKMDTFKLVLFFFFFKYYKYFHFDQRYAKFCSICV